LMRKVPGCQSAIADASGAEAAVKLKDGDKITFGDGRYVECRSTPGACVCMCVCFVIRLID
jgi:hypothetical protein